MRRITYALLPLLLACSPDGTGPGRGFAEVEPGQFHATLSDFDADLDAAGLRATGRFDRVALSVVGYGRADAPEPVAAGEVVATACPPGAGCEEELRITRAGLTEWWRERGASLEQGFTLHHRPEGAGPVVLDLRLDGAVARPTDRGASWRTPGGEIWRYEKLRAHDQRGRALDAWMVVETHRIRLHIDADDAAWPVEVDPTLTIDEQVITASDATASLEFGEVVSSGDMNGDGYDDLTVGASQSDVMASTAGAAYLYEGGPDGIDTTTEQIFFASDASSSDAFGRGVQLGGDFDGDGNLDLAVGAPRGDGRRSGTGSVYIYTGSSAGPSSSAETKVYASDITSAGYFGSPISRPGDLDGDGIDDLAIRASGVSAVYVYFGSSAGLTDETKLKASTYGLSNMGQFLEIGGDINGDGYAELLVGCPDRDGRVASSGVVYVFHGDSAGLDASAPETVYASDGAKDDKFGPLTSPGDLNADGYDELAVGARQDDDSGTDSGAVYVYLGSAVGVSVSDETKITASTGAASDNFGIDVAAGGDSAGDLVLLVGASKATGSATASGSLFGYQSDGSMIDISTEIEYPATGASTDDELGEDIWGRTDVNGDGFNDWIAGAIGNDDGGSRAGAVFVLEQGIDADEDGFTAGEDCDDADDSVHPGASEACDGVDNDCDEDTEDVCYSIDADGDGYGDADSHEVTGGTGYVDNDDDCDDADASIHPDASEIAGDEIDQDCDGEERCYQDLDGDGVRTDVTVDSSDADCADAVEATAAATDGDCDDTDASTWPGAPEIVDDGIDEDCDGLEDCHVDVDADGYRPDDSVVASADADCTSPGEAGAATPDGDCDDLDAAISPAAREGTGDEIDQDCDGAETCFLDADDDGYRPDATSEAASADTTCTDPGEARFDAPVGDCDDADASLYPGATEIVGDEVDQDCDGAELCYLDADDDGYRPDESSTTVSPDTSCAEAGEAAPSDPTGDCDDGDATVYPGAPELADGLDNDCNGYDELVDADSDGLTELDELALGTDPDDADSDDDGLSDGEEVDSLGTDPLSTDSDLDGLSDAEEANTTATDPNDADSDDDGLSDAEEVWTEGTDPNDADTDDDGLSDGEELSTTGTDPNDADSDDDALSDGEELAIYGTDPNDANGDNDGLSDGEEVLIHGTDPWDEDSDDDTLLDGEEVEVTGTDPNDNDTDDDALDDAREVEVTGTSPTNPDTDGDSLGDGEEIETWDTDPLDADSDGDGLDDAVEVLWTETDPLGADSDGDGLSDGEEVMTWHTDPMRADSDGDGLSDAQEVEDLGTNPNAADTDGGWVDDGEEIEAGTDPLVASDDLEDKVVKNSGCNTGEAGGDWGWVVVAGVLVGTMRRPAGARARCRTRRRTSAVLSNTRTPRA